MTVFVDSGAWIALALPRDTHHERAVRAYRDTLRSTRLVTTSDVIAESLTRVRYDGGHDAALRLRRAIDAAVDSGKLTIVWMTEEIHRDAWKVFTTFASLRLSFVDATSAAVAKRRKATTVFGFDADFRAMGFDVIPA